MPSSWVNWPRLSLGLVLCLAIALVQAEVASYEPGKANITGPMSLDDLDDKLQVWQDISLWEFFGFHQANFSPLSNAPSSKPSPTRSWPGCPARPRTLHAFSPSCSPARPPPLTPSWPRSTFPARPTSYSPSAHPISTPHLYLSWSRSPSAD